MPKNEFTAANDNDAAQADTVVKQTVSSPIPQQAIADAGHHWQLSTIVNVLAKNAAREWLESLKATNDNAEPTDDMGDSGVSVADIACHSASDAITLSDDEGDDLSKTLDDIQLSDNALGQGLNDSRFNSIFGEF